MDEPRDQVSYLHQVVGCSAQSWHLYNGENECQPVIYTELGQVAHLPLSVALGPIMVLEGGAKGGFLSTSGGGLLSEWVVLSVSCLSGGGSLSAPTMGKMNVSPLPYLLLVVHCCAHSLAAHTPLVWCTSSRMPHPQGQPTK